MKCKVIGTEDVNYVSKKDGKTVTGIRLTVVYNTTKRNAEGLEARSIYCPEAILNGQRGFMGQTVNLNYVPSSYGADKFDLAGVEILEGE